MSSDRIDAESKVSGNQANIPARIRELNIDDGDRNRGHLEDDGSIRVQVIQQQTGTFADFDGYAGEDQPMSRASTTPGASTSNKCRAHSLIRQSSLLPHTGRMDPTMPRFLCSGHRQWNTPEAVILDYVLAETLNGLTTHAGHDAAVDLLNRIEENAHFHIDSLTTDALATGEGPLSPTRTALLVDACIIAYTCKPRGSATCMRLTTILMLSRISIGSIQLRTHTIELTLETARLVTMSVSPGVYSPQGRDIGICQRTIFL